jgi:predicted short-subunit dehydrogenase-like oxidoreductase (DUF2520 family)
LGGRACLHIRDIVVRSPDVYFIAVPDHALPEVAADLAALLPSSQSPLTPASRPLTPSSSRSQSGPVVAHTSGATTVSVLLPCERVGASTLVFHPLQTFSDPIAHYHCFAGAAVAITPLSPEPAAPATVLGYALAEILGARPFLLADEKRGLYHAAATLACNYFVALEHQSRDLFVKSGLPADDALSLFLPLVRATLNNMEESGTVLALTGPLSRGDTETIRGHLAALKLEAPDLLPMYRALALAALDVVRMRAEMKADTIDELADLLWPPQEDDGTTGPVSHPSRDRSR